MILLIIVYTESFAGEIFYSTSDSVFNTVIAKMDSRQLRQFVVGPAPNQVIMVYESGWALDPDVGVLSIYGPGGGLGYSDVIYYNIHTTSIVGFRTGPSQQVNALAHDPVHFPAPTFPNLYSPIYFDSMTRSTFFGSLELYNIGISVGGADWYDRGEYIIAATGNIGMLDFYEVHADTGQTSWLGSNSDVHALWYELAYDKDVNVLWYLDQRTLFGLDPESFDTVARLRPAGIGFEGGAGSIDNVPDQTPEILVTGECPGTLYVTVVDATPGGQVLVASGTRRGQRVLRSGACAGAVTDLANPTPRFDLVARPTGIATTTIRATAPMCNTVAFQAIDVATCKVTSARVAQTMLLAP